MADNAPVTPPKSPDGLEIRGAPMTSARLNKKAAIAATVVVAAILGVIVTNVSSEKPKKTAEEDAPKKNLEPALNAAKTLTKDVPDIVAEPKQSEPPPSLPPTLPSKPEPTSSASPPAPVKTVEDDARLADTALPKFSAGEGSGLVAAVNSGGGNASNLGRAANGLLNSGLAAAGNGETGDEPDLNRQAQKLAFKQQTHKSSYLNSQLTPPVSPFELKTGTVIPSILVSELNSDLPGEIIAQVSQNVYDTATGNHLLIPQGTKLFGRYDSQISFGQERLLVTWQRLIYPNAYTLELGGMAGHDQEGKAGFADRVNNHYGRIFGWGLLTSLLSAAYQLSQPAQDRNSDRAPSNQQVMGAAVGQQMAQLGMEMAKRNMRVQPTIEIRKGYRLNVMVNKDITFPGTYDF
ncbi:TrbI/VirB10 family protein [Chitinivorax sp. B]|uniref:TrbI/VirB10 family protein n=1 Tax=Chitinivorax sp. B TaxID=2502235 RepID=UPI0010F51CEC|nr:TrbI/VirB10 family protein [Chitinivorax sp. B]